MAEIRRGEVVLKTTLVDQITSILQDRILDGYYQPGSQLPVEEKLVAEFNTSRTTIRGAIDRLISKNLVARRRGVGTFVMEQPKILNPLDTFIDFYELLRNNGVEPGFFCESLDEIEPEKKIMEALGLDPGEKVLQIVKYWTSDGDPVVFCENYIPSKFFSSVVLNDLQKIEDETEPILKFMGTFCQQLPNQYVASIRCGLVRDCGFSGFQKKYASDSPLLMIQQTGYTIKGEAIHHAVEYHPDNLMTFSITRRM